MVNYFEVFYKILSTKILFGVIVGVCYLAILLTNLFLIYRFTPAHLSPAFMGGTDFVGGDSNNPGDTRKLIYGGLTPPRNTFQYPDGLHCQRSMGNLSTLP